jgi:transposase-like protein
MTDFVKDLPESITVDSTILKKRPGRKTDIERRRNSTPVQGKVKGKRTHFTDKEKLRAVSTYAVAGNSRRVAEITGIPEGTIRSWKSTEWWHEAMQKIVVEQDDELGTKLTNLVNKAVDEVNDRLENGNYVYNPKLDKLIRKPVDAKELAIVTAISIDKRQLLRGLPTSRTESVSQTDRLTKLQEQFKQFVTAKEVKQVEGEIVEEELEVFDEDVQEEVEPLTINELFSE